MKKLCLITILAGIMAFALSCDKDCEPTGNCALDPDPGPCEAAIPKYYYDKEAGKCKEFLWGGCDGTVPFNTLEECENSCL